MTESAQELAEISAATKELLKWEGEQGTLELPAPAAPQTTVVEPEPSTAKAPAHNLRPQLELLQNEAAACTRCDLHKGRTRSVFARGNPETDLVFVGEGPGYHEDQQGLPFVGRAGQLLDRMIDAMGYPREGVYICNVVKCRPPENRTPHATESIACSRFLKAQLELIAPKAIVALGRCASEALGCVPPSGKWRGQWGAWQGIPVMPTYHPAFLLRSPQFKRPVWEDLQEVMKRVGRVPPQQGQRT